MKPLDLDPAERNPIAIRNTVLALVGLMFLGGIFVFIKYKKYQEEGKIETEKGRAPKIGRIYKNFAAIAQDGKTHSLFELEEKGKTYAIAVISPTENNSLTLQYMKRLSKLYKNDNRVHLVCLSLGDPKKFGHRHLSQLANQIGADVQQWWFMAAEPKNVFGFAKKFLTLSVGENPDGTWAIANQIRIVDKSRRLRGEHLQFDFDLAHKRQLEAQKVILDSPERIEEDLVKFYLQLPEYWEKRMYKVIDYCLIENEPDKDPNYLKAIMVAIGILGFVILMILRMRAKELQK